ncbi:MAG: biotin transporter BioY [Clostridia bacterium]|nr:biotin transporter BioY [Clostridia bacterium]
MKHKSQKIVMCALFTVLIAVGAFLRIPLPLPITFQLFFVVLAGLLLGSKLGATSAALYMIIGLIGIPVFTQGGGVSYVAQPTFGYIVGFIPAAFLVGFITERKKNPSLKTSLLACLVGLLATYCVGMIYYYLIWRFVLNVELGIWIVFLRCFVLVAPGDIALCFAAALLNGKLKRFAP